ncbi:amidohydrolase family protein [Kribbella lupini]|uniref:Amidohydrolase family protein n=2 Tax=Kribbella lupini TaxID=291602 RepID=A0ABP4NCJ7_9ACTN
MITVLSNGLIFDGVADDLVPGHVVIEGDRIVGVTERLGPVAADARVIDVRGRAVMPGLIDAHIHAYSPRPNADRLPMTMVAHWARKMLESCLQRGFTTVRDVGGADHGLRRAIDAGWIDGPHLIYCGKALSQTGGHGDKREAGTDGWCVHHGYAGHTSRVVDGADNVRRAVREELRLGAGFIKIMASGGGLSPTDELEDAQYSEDEIGAAVDEAVRCHRYVTAHAHPDAVISRCLELGVRCFEHGTMISDRTAARAVELGASVVPTLTVGRAVARHGRELGFDEAILRKVAAVNALSLESLERLHRSGVRTGFGTDLVTGLDHYQYEEFRIRGEVCPAVDVLRSATSVNAEIVRRQDAGRIAAGLVADVIAVAGNPLDDLSVFTDDGHNVQLVMKGGIVVKDTLSS